MLDGMDNSEQDRLLLPAPGTDEYVVRVADEYGDVALGVECAWPGGGVPAGVNSDSETKQL